MSKRQFHKRLIDIPDYLLEHHQVTNRGCWELDNYAGSYGRPALSFSGRRRYVYQWAALVWLDFNVWNVAGWQINHHCDNPRCFNPKHLFIGKQKDNVKDMCRKGRNTPKRLGSPPPTRLREWQVLDIRMRANRGEPYQHIGRQHGIAARTASEIARRKRWVHID